MTLAAEDDRSVADRVAAVRARIAAACERAGRDPASVRLVAATKTVPPERICEALAAGVRDVGENRVQEAAAKRDRVRGEATWHLIGHLQRNKAGRAATLFDMVQSLDGFGVARTLAERRPPEADPLGVLVEVELTGLPRRTGVPEDGVADVVRVAADLPRLRVLGLMAMATPGDPEDARAVFRRLRALRDRLRDRLALPLPELSMGMSDDLEVAVEEGATMVRVGRAIFGERAAERRPAIG